MRRTYRSAVLMVVFAGLLGLGVSSAAGTPEIGRCLKVTGDETGNYSSANCTKAKAGGAYFFHPGAAVGFSISSSGPVTFEAGNEELVCAGESGFGQYSGTDEVANVRLTLTRCVFTGFPGGIACQNTATAGEIVSEAPLSGVYGVITSSAGKPTQDKLGLDLAGVGPDQVVLGYGCGSSETAGNEVVGSLIVPVKANKMLSVQKLKYVRSGSRQIPEGFEGMPADVLSRSIGGGPFEQAAESAKITMTSEEPVEINSVL
jgi:hypothetical protein